MKKVLFSLVLLIFYFSSGFTQEDTYSCGTSTNANTDTFDLTAANATVAEKSLPDIVEIPIVFHVIYQGDLGVISDADLFNAVDELNYLFANSTEGTDSNIRFKLAEYDPEGNCSNGIDRIESENTNWVASSTTGDFRALNKWNPLQYHNIWVAETVMTSSGNSVGGYTMFPTAANVDNRHIVVKRSSLIPWFDLSPRKTLAHEFGHSFSLYHTWGPGNDSSFQPICERCHSEEDCLTKGDRVCDTTPYAGGFNEGGSVPDPEPCESKYSTCIAGAGEDDCYVPNTGILPSRNTMSYSYVPGCVAFTPGQFDRMTVSLNTYYQHFVNPTDPYCIENSSISELYGTGNISSGENICISGELRIDVPGFIFFDANITMQEGAVITVESGNLLVLNNGTEIKGCEKMHRGIQMEPNSYVEVVNSTIEDAQYAIKGNTDCVIYTEENDFNKNYISIYAPEGCTVDGLVNNNFNGNSLLPAYQTPIAQFPAPGTRSYAGVILENAGSVTSANNNFTGLINGILATSTNLSSKNDNFSDINQAPPGPFGGQQSTAPAYGIRAESSTGSLEVISSDFTNCNYGIRVSGMHTHIGGNQMSNMYHGIQLKGASNKKILINSNTISADQVGISLSHIYNDEYVRVSFNEINMDVDFTYDTSSGTAISVYNESASVLNDTKININDINLHGKNIGIKINDANNLSVEDNIISSSGGVAANAGILFDHAVDCEAHCNVITGTGTVPVFGNETFGIDVLSSTGSRYVCNSIDNTTTGIRFASTCTDTDLRGTQFGNLGTGLHLSQLADFGVQNAQEHHGNRWNGSYNEYGAVNEAMGDNVSLSRFIVHTDANSFHPPSINTPNSNSDWFILGQAESIYSCGSSLCATTEGFISHGGGITDFDKEIAKGLIDWGIFDEERKWLAERFLYKKISEDLSLLGQDADVDAFFSANGTGTLHDLDKLDKDKETIYVLDSGTKLQIEEYRIQTEEYLEEMKSLDTQIAAATSVSQKEQIRSEKSVVMNMLKSLSISQRDYEAVVKAARSSQAELIKTENGQVYTSSLYEGNEKQVNSIFLSTVAKGVYELTETQISELSMIAIQCPITGGNSVFTARSLLTLADDYTDYDDFALCLMSGVVLNTGPDDGNTIENEEENGRNDTITQEENGITLSEENTIYSRSKFRVYPNPADNLLFIEGQIEYGQTVQIFDFLGRIILTIDSNNEQTQLNTSAWSDGLYYVTYNIDSNTKVTEKIVIIH